MLILSRKVDERVIITTPDGKEISVMLVRQGTDRARLGFEAPANYRIRREELRSVAGSTEGDAKV